MSGLRLNIIRQKIKSIYKLTDILMCVKIRIGEWVSVRVSSRLPPRPCLPQWWLVLVVLYLQSLGQCRAYIPRLGIALFIVSCSSIVVRFKRRCYLTNIKGVCLFSNYLLSAIVLAVWQLRFVKEGVNTHPYKIIFTPIFVETCFD